MLFIYLMGESSDVSIILNRAEIQRKIWWPSFDVIYLMDESSDVTIMQDTYY